MNADTMRAKPWRDLTDDALARVAHIPCMLNAEEAQLYVWLAKHLAGSDGHIVDLGCFVGGSTAFLAEGQRQGGGSAHIFAFDQFRASQKVKERQLYAKGIAPFYGHDTLPLCQALLAPWSPQITLRKGRIEDAEWTEGPISLLILDASKSTTTMDKMAEIFFPHLNPGVSVIVQQDELHWREPWIAVQMQILKDWFAPLCFVPGGAVAYRCTQKITPCMLRARRVKGLDDEAMIWALSGAKERLNAFGVGGKIRRQIAGIRLNPGTRESWRFTNRAPLM